MTELLEPRWARRITQDLSPPFGGGVLAPLSMIYGNPDPALFPAAGMAEATARVLADPTLAPLALQYGAIQGQPNLISMLVDKLNHDEGLDVSPANILITNGASAAIGLAARALVDEGDVVLVEGPSFPGAMSVLRRTGAELQMLPMGPDGLDIAGTEAVLDALHVRGVYPPLLY
ncbi:MAG TPA: aminotransferase class I/II-fold pyridoxal phosphate-dependent enzyme, partial [Chloroflexia bacterium]|nr:aminotransferase class I/II-fold pyridoxal phosphate-dependent enzyme [Chloroflexia bacterium]